MSATGESFLHRLDAVIVRSVRPRRCDPEGAQTRCERRWIDTKQLSRAARAINAALGPLHCRYQIHPLALATLAVLQNDLWYIGGRAQAPGRSASAMSRRFACDGER